MFSGVAFLFLVVSRYVGEIVGVAPATRPLEGVPRNPGVSLGPLLEPIDPEVEARPVRLAPCRDTPNRKPGLSIFGFEDLSLPSDFLVPHNNRVTV
jgi:hypothetical protein